ncbi:MAG: VapE domain-containing protein [Pseudomonadota bacterium]
MPLPNLVGYAIAYARRGWPVFPLHTPIGSAECSCGDSKCASKHRAGKHPRTEHGLTDATTDEATIRGWWSRWPDANIAIATGAARLLVIDVDPRSGGAASWSSLVTAHDPIGYTPTVRTGSDGDHVYLAAPSYPVQSKAGALGPGVDIKSDGGYVVAPPSLHQSGQRYDWRPESNPGDVDVAACPQWILERLRERKPRGKRPDSKLAAAFAAAGWLGKRERDGQWRCLCPWSDQHTSGGELDGSTVLLPTTSEHPRPRWHCSHGHCSDRTTGDVWSKLPRAAVLAAEQEWGEENDPEPGATSEDRPVQADDSGDGWTEELIRKAKGDLVACESNAMLILAHDPRWKGVIRWDEFRCRVAICGTPPWADHEAAPSTGACWTDEDAVRLSSWLHRAWRIRVAPGACHGVASVVARRDPFHPIREYLEGLQWDATIRLDRWLTEYLGAEETEYTRAVGVRWLISAVARVMDPGCQVDHMLVLEGPQGRRKSTALRTLCGPEWYAERISEPTKKDAAEEMAGCWIAEFSEMASIRRSDVESVKAFISRRVDRYRPSYGRSVVEQPRQCVLAGSTNENCYLADSTGARRFWPVACGTIEIEAITRDRDQIWAEARSRYVSGERWWLETEALAAQASGEQDARYTGDPWTDLVAEWLESPTCADSLRADGGITVRQLLGAIGVEPAKRTRADEMRVAAILKRLGCLRSARKDPFDPRRWAPPANLANQPTYSR